MPLYELMFAKTKDDSGRLTYETDYAPAMEAALASYSKHRPREVVFDLVGNGGSDLALPAGWVAEFSRILAVEYPVGENPPHLLAADEWSLYRSPQGYQLRLRLDKPAAGESVRLTYTAPRTETELPAADLDAVACLAASICLRTLAALYGQTSDPTIQADVVNYRSKTDEFRRLADALEERFHVHLGIDPRGGVVAASAVAGAPSRSRTRLTHGGR